MRPVSADARREQVLGQLADHYAAGHLHTATYELRVAEVLTSAAAPEATWDLPPLGPLLLERARSLVLRPRPCARLYFDAPGLGFVDLAAGPRTWAIGRSPDCDVVLRDPAVSRRHALVSSRGGRCAVRDLGSRNGVTRNGVPVAVAVLQPGDVLRFGDAVVAHVR